MVPMFKFLRFSVLVVATLMVSGLASAQTAMVRRDVNLRSDPSTSVKPITLLTPPAQLTLVEPNQQNAFYHVRTSDGKEGWVWAKNITLNPPFGDALPHFPLPCLILNRKALSDAGSYHENMGWPSLARDRKACSCSDAGPQRNGDAGNAKAN